MTGATHRLFITVLACLLYAACRADDRAAESLVDFPKSKVTLQSATGAHPIDTWIAADSAHRARGLMFVRSLAPDSGMLFLFGDIQYVSMWMKNTYVALDMLFIDRTGRIVNIAENTKPLTLDAIGSTAAVRAVLELPAGTVKRFRLRPGDRVVHPAFEL